MSLLVKFSRILWINLRSVIYVCYCPSEKLLFFRSISSANDASILLSPLFVLKANMALRKFHCYAVGSLKPHEMAEIT